jgi:hypothetical protein
MKLLLKSNDIPRITSLSGNIDIDSLKPHIFTAQVTDIKRILGVDLYNKMLDDTLVDEYLTIYDDYLIYILSYYAATYFMDDALFKIVNNGVFKMTLENGETATLKEVQYLAEKKRKLAINFEGQLLEYLKTIDIPEYTTENIVKKKPFNTWY